MNTKKLENFFEKHDFNVHLFEREGMSCAEIETWTDGGVNMIINLMPFTAEEFIEYVEGFNVDEEIDMHRENIQYKNDFTVSESLKDFTNFYERLKKLSKLIY